MSSLPHAAAEDRAQWQADTRPPLPPYSVGDLLRVQAKRFSDRPALHFLLKSDSDEIVALTYRQLLEQSERCARGLAACIRPRERIALWSRNTVESVILQYACAMSGAILVPFNTAWTDAELDHALCLTGAALVFVGLDHAGRELEGRLRAVARVPVKPLSGINNLASEGKDHVLPMVSVADPCLIQFTSGTTGKAKGALLSHRAALLGGWLRPNCEGADEYDVWLNAVPYHHVGGSCAIVLGALSVGGSFVVLERFDRDQLIRLIPVVGATRMGGVPTMWHDILSSPLLSDAVKLNSVSLGGASVPAALIQSIYQRLGARCGIGYGQSECPIVTATLPDDPVELVCDTVGRPLPHVELKIVDPTTGTTLRYDEPGEICVRAPVCMDGYWDDPKATAQTIDTDGFLHTGDIGSLDRQGYCRIRGRLREVIIRGGENIYPAEIEEVLLQHPAVAMAAVVGVDHPRLGQEVGAVIKLRAGAQLEFAELERHAARFVASYKVPKTWHLIETMPVTASGKIRKVELERIFKSP